MSITVKVVELVDKLGLNHFFIEKNNRLYFSPIKIRLNKDLLESSIDRFLKTKGRAYKPNDLEKDVLKELDF